MILKREDATLKENIGPDLTAKALELGASRAAMIPSRKIQVRDDLAGLCETCPNQGQALSCPPHVPGPEQFRAWVLTYSQALVFRIDVDTDLLLSEQRYEIYQVLHEMAAGLETAAADLGFSKPMAFAGGSCKSVFCRDTACQALDPTGRCRFPDQARPSMSGFGIDVAALIETAGWKREAFLEGGNLSESNRSGVLGLVLLRLTPQCLSCQNPGRR